MEVRDVYVKSIVMSPSCSDVLYKILKMHIMYIIDVDAEKFEYLDYCNDLADAMYTYTNTLSTDTL